MAIVRADVAAKRTAAEHDIEEPVTAAKHTVRTGFRPLRILYNPLCLALIIVVSTMPIRTPLPNIAMHIIKPKDIGRITSNRGCFP